MLNETIRSGYTVPRGAISTDDTLVTAAADTMMFADIPDGSYKPPMTQNAVEVAFSMGADAQSCVAYLFAARKTGDIVLVWTGTITAGAQEATDGLFYVDTLAGSTDTWITTIKEVDGGGNDRMARIVLDTCGYHTFFTQFTGLSSESVKTHFSGF
jgi:hypothetical protein